MSNPHLTGTVDDRDTIIEGLRVQLSKLDEALRLERNKNGQVEAGARELRRVLSPLYRALQAVFGELDEMGVAEIAPQAQPASVSAARWQPIMNKLGGNRAKFIQALLDFGPSTASQVRAAMAITRMQSVYDVAHQLMKLGVVVKRGEQYSLKE